MILNVAALLHPALGQDQATNAASDALPPGVTADMEKDFVARYQAALKIAKGAKDPSGLAAYYALFAMDPAVPPEGKKAFDDFAVFAIAMDASGGEPSYSFIPVPAADKASGEAPLTLAGKVYTQYLPPVISLKTTLAPPAHPDPSGMTPNGSTRPLCIENGRLMFVGIKPVPGAVPPPVDNPADNFGLTPNHLKQGDTDDDQDFTSLDKFLAALKQPNVEVLESGQNDYVYYAICRVKPDLLVFVNGDRPGKDSFTYTFQVTNPATQSQFKSDKKQITLAEEPPGVDGKPVPILQGDVYHPDAGYTGMISFVGRFGDETSDPNLKPSLSKTVDWK